MISMWRPCRHDVLGLCHGLGLRLEASPLTFVWALKLLGQKEGCDDETNGWKCQMEMHSTAQCWDDSHAHCAHLLWVQSWPLTRCQSQNHIPLWFSSDDNRPNNIAWQVFYETETMTKRDNLQCKHYFSRLCVSIFDSFIHAYIYIYLSLKGLELFCCDIV